MSSISDENEVIRRWIERINSLDNNDNFSPYRSNDTNSLIVSQIQSTNKLSECDNIQQLIKKNENELTDLQNKFNQILQLNVSKSIWSTMNYIISLSVSLVVIILWTYSYSSHFFKLMLGFIFGVISFGILFFLQYFNNNQVFIE